MPVDRVAATGAVRTVAPDELFFSVTDRKGVITAANSVFERLSRFARTDLIGAPHNVIRHPEMPGGAFRLMWDTLLAGRPFAAYVRNLAKDGASYDVFATVTPLGDGFLSVRSAPMAAPLRDAAFDLYAETLPRERACRAEGGSAARAAAAGAEDLAARLGTAGYASYEEFMFTALPAEVVSRVAASAPSAGREAPGAVGEVLAAALDVSAGLADALGRLDALKELVDDLQIASEGARITADDLGAATSAAGRASSHVAGTAPVLARTSAAMDRLAAELAGSLAGLAEALATVRLTVMEQRFRIALARQHSDVVVAFADEVISGGTTADDLAHVVPLCRALQEDLDALTASGERSARQLAAVRDEVEATRGRLEQFRTFLSTWRLQVPRYGVTQQLGPHVGPIDDLLARGHGRIAALRRLAEQCVAQAAPVDAAALVGPLWRLTDLVATLRTDTDTDAATHADAATDADGADPVRPVEPSEAAS